MLKKIIIFVLVIIVSASCFPFTAWPAEYSSGFSDSDGYTDSDNMYFFNPVTAFAIINKEVDTDPNYDFLPSGAELFLPVFVYPSNGDNAIPATDKMIKTDNVTVSSKVLTGRTYIGAIELVDSKKLKIKSVPAGVYVKIPVTQNFDKLERAGVLAKFVISVNNYTYDLTESTLKCSITNPVTYIDRNSVYGAKTPTMFKTDKLYYGEATFDFGNNIKYTARVKGSESYYLNLSREPVSDIKAMYPGAWLDFYSFIGDYKTFQTAGTLEIPINRSNLGKKGQSPELYAYRIDGTTLTALGAGSVGFDSKNNKLHIKTKTLGNYVLSNRALMRNISANADDNILRSGYATSVSSSEASSK